MPKPKRKKEIIEFDDHYSIELSQGYFCKIDKEDLSKIDYCNWHYTKALETKLDMLEAQP